MLSRKIFTGFLAIALVAGFYVSYAGAQTTVMQQTTTVSTSYTFNTNLTVGSTGADVVALQSILVAKGFLTMPTGVAMGYFGPLTRSALAAWQASVGISPAAGYFGPITRAYFNTHNMTSTSTTTTTTVPGCAPGAMFSSTTGARCDTTTLPAGCTSTAGYSSTTGAKCDGSTSGGSSTPNGEEGQLTNIETTGGTDSSVEEGDEDAKVLAVSMDVEDGDVVLDRVDVDFDLSGVTGGASANLSQYISSVSLWLGDDELDSMDVEDGDRDGDVTSFRFTGLDGMMEEGSTEKLYVAVDAVESVDADEESEDVSVEIPEDGIRITTGNDVSETYDNADLTDTFSIVEASTGDVTLSSEESDNPDVTMEADDEDTTDDVTLLTFSLRSKDQMNTIREITVDLDANTGATSSDIVDTLYLFADGEEIDSKSVGSGSADVAVTFDDLDFDLDEDETVDFEVRADINELDGTDFAEGDSITASIDNAGVEAEDENGEDADVSGSADGGTITFRTEGVSLSGPTTSASVDDHGDASATDSTGEYSVQFKVNAFGDTVYIPLTTARSSSTTPTSAGVYYVVEDANGNVVTTGTTTAVASQVSGGDTVTSGGVTYLKVNDGQSATMKLNVSYDPLTNGFYRVQLFAVNFHATTADTPDQQVIASPEEDYQTGFANIQ